MYRRYFSVPKFRGSRAQFFAFAILLVGVVFVGVRVVGAFTGPATSPGQGGGALQYNATSKSVGINVAPQDASQSSLIVAPTSSQIYGIEVRRASGAPIITTSDAEGVALATSTANATTTVNGNLIVTGTINGTLGNITVDAGNVTPNVFNINVASGTGNYAFPVRLGVGTSTTTNLPQTLSVYGSAYIKDTAQIGTSSAPVYGGVLTLGGVLTVPGGQIASGYPYYTFSNDTNTGMYRAGSDTLGFTTNASDTLMMRYVVTTNSHQVYIPSGGTAGYPSFLVGSSLSGGSSGGGGGLFAPGTGILGFVTGGFDSSIERMRIVSSTGLGIHTQTPQYTLDVNGHMRLMPTSTIPLASDGAIYYDSNAAKFKCHEGGWWNCVGAGGSGASAPNASDCDTDAERGRLFIETTNNYFYVCNGAVRGWDYVSLTN